MDRTPDGSETGGGGMPPLDLRVARLEDGLADLKTLLRTIEAKLGAMDTKLSALDTKLSTVAESVAEMRGRLPQSPTWVQLIVALIATWGAGAATVGSNFRLGIR
ncbi:hypothetical protein CCR97_29495 [Rhodoplanes elegans]|uniref:Uncharacterized protein n=1 Tax=Rhodoplanes elegans TaxID=29408 RepID=A0A327KF22_9BRAD|nr:hypothetical protein [Rhodoplanes elegans]MBK5962293.1 hypothetical protein [Rhodoplanes elegans]RAI33848.1 hypothetical protein CH338_21880 [Rhodoplanes elegans]